ncbi:hypothetical protein C8Q77DRAFT_1153047 [Trametes polyzona]|nr:hypothetical protein C8Q77DRAFT_1153047 [Trametes polyzona]
MIQLSPAVEAEIASAYQGLIFNAYVSLAAAVFPLYDMLLNLDRELEYIWLSRRHWVSRTIYVLNRYMVLPCVSAPILGAFIPFSDSLTVLLSCIALTWLIDVTATLTLLGSTTFSILRVYALSGRNSLLGGTMLALSLASAVLTTFSFVHIVPTNIPSSSPQLCAFGLRGLIFAVAAP